MAHFESFKPIIVGGAHESSLGRILQLSSMIDVMHLRLKRDAKENKDNEIMIIATDDMYKRVKHHLDYAETGDWRFKLRRQYTPLHQTESIQNFIHLSLDHKSFKEPSPVKKELWLEGFEAWLHNVKH